MPRSHPLARSVFGSLARRLALVAALCAGFASAGCVFIGDGEARDEAEDARERAREAVEDFSEGISEAAEEFGAAMSEWAEELSAEALSGETRVENPIGFRDLYAFLPERIGDFRRVSREGGTGGALGFNVSHVEAEYKTGDGAEVEVSIVDAGALPVIGSEGFLEWLDVNVEEESDRGWARTVEYKGFRVIEEFRRTRDDRGRGDFTWFVEGRFIVALEGRDVMADELREVRDAIDTDGLAALRDREGG